MIITNCQKCNIILSNKNRTKLCRSCFKFNKKLLREDLKITKDFKIKIIEKQCRKCFQLCLINKFNYNYYYPDGHHPVCKICLNKIKTSNANRQKNRIRYYENLELTNLKQRKKYSKRKDDPVFRLRNSVSCTVNQALKKQFSCKKSSTFKKLPYSVLELRQHLENLFEPWMSWNNYGKYSSNNETWNIDHIIPQSLLPYSSMEEENFKKCWDLSNLRPLKSIENIRKSNKLLG